MGPTKHTVLHVIDLAHAGGAQEVLLNIATRLDPNRWESVVALPTTGWLNDNLQRAGIRTVIVPMHGGAYDWRYLAKLAAITRQFSVSIIHAHLLAPAVYSGLVGLALRTPLIATFHGQVDMAPDERLRGLKFGIINRACDRVTFVSEALRRWFVERTRLQPEITEVVYNGIDIGAFACAKARGFREELGIEPHHVLVGAVGNVRAPKSYDVFLNAAALLIERSQAFRFVIVGAPDDMSLFERLHEMAADLGLDPYLSFTGFRSDIPDILADVDVYGITSRSEGLSLSTIQAMAVGVPVVTTRSGGPEEIVQDGETGLLTAVGDVRAFADAIERVATDRALSDRLVKAARRSIEGRFDVESTVHRYQQIYSTLVDNDL